MDNENMWDQLLQIQTSGMDDTNSDEYRYPYEPTPYSILERLARSGLIGKTDTLLDYGCGKGRVGFFLSHHTGANVIGVEYDERICQIALKNRRPNDLAVDFVLLNAEKYVVPLSVNRCYFFNPFSVQILHKVMARILASYYEAPREILLFFYYPSDEYISYLMSVNELEFYDEIECNDLFDKKDLRERILIFRLPA